MAAPEHVPTKTGEQVRTYASPPRRPASWRARRPADFAEEHRQPHGELLGNPGPDQGYALKLGRLLEPELHLAEGEHARDALAGIVAVAIKRAAVFGRAPIMHDLRVAATLFGFLDASADPELVRWRREELEELGHFHHYTELRHVVDRVPVDVLRLTPAEVTQRYQAGWRNQLSVDRT